MGDLINYLFGWDSKGFDITLKYDIEADLEAARVLGQIPCYEWSPNHEFVAGILRGKYSSGTCPSFEYSWTSESQKQRYWKIHEEICFLLDITFKPDYSKIH